MIFDDLKAKIEGDRRLRTKEKIVKQRSNARGIVLLPYFAVAALKTIIWIAKTISHSARGAVVKPSNSIAML